MQIPSRCISWETPLHPWHPVSTSDGAVNPLPRATESLNIVLQRQELNVSCFQPAVGLAPQPPQAGAGLRSAPHVSVLPVDRCPPRAGSSDGGSLELKRGRQNTQAHLRPWLSSCPSKPSPRRARVDGEGYARLRLGGEWRGNRVWVHNPTAGGGVGPGTPLSRGYTQECHGWLTGCADPA